MTTKNVETTEATRILRYPGSLSILIAVYCGKMNLEGKKCHLTFQPTSLSKISKHSSIITVRTCSFVITYLGESNTTQKM